MFGFFEHLGSLTALQVAGYAFVVCAIMIAIPFAEVIRKLVLKLVYLRRMSIGHFSYQFKPVELIQERDSERIVDVYEHPDFVIEGSTVLLHWSVSGELSVFLDPLGGKVKGNFAEVVVDRTRRRFQLTVRGLFSKEVATIEIPLYKIKAIETNSLSNTKTVSNLRQVGSFGFTRVSMVHQLLKKEIPTILIGKKNSVACKPMKLVPMALEGGKFYRSPDKNQMLKGALETKINERRILKSYKFSTAKYNKVNGFNSPRS